jgi:[ribosomal protein S5]-alanine N-acetyltransferase
MMHVIFAYKGSNLSIDAAFTDFPTLTTERLLLRKIQMEDAETLFAIFSDEEVMKLQGDPPHVSLDDTQSSIERIQIRYHNREGIRWGITLQGQDTVIGTGSFHSLNEAHHYVEVGYNLNRAYWGQGIMTEALSAVLTYGFTEMEMHRIEARIDISNERSKSLLERLGFTYEGNLRQRFFFNGQFEDDHYFGLLKDEWQGAQ